MHEAETLRLKNKNREYQVLSHRERKLIEAVEATKRKQEAERIRKAKNRDRQQDPIQKEKAKARRIQKKKEVAADRVQKAKVAERQHHQFESEKTVLPAKQVPRCVHCEVMLGCVS